MCYVKRAVFIIHNVTTATKENITYIYYIHPSTYKLYLEGIPDCAMYNYVGVGMLSRLFFSRLQ